MKRTKSASIGLTLLAIGLTLIAIGLFGKFNALHHLVDLITGVACFFMATGFSVTLWEQVRLGRKKAK